VKNNSYLSIVSAFPFGEKESFTKVNLKPSVYYVCSKSVYAFILILSIIAATCRGVELS
jgi:hypothetical protein